jgi:FkbM family methyltransferase
MLLNALHGVLANFNDRALFQVPLFRQRQAGSYPHPYDDDFFRTREEYPYFGYVLAQNDGCDDIWLISQDDDLVAQHYFWYGRNGYEPTAVREWIARSRTPGIVFDIGAFSGLYGLLSYFTNMENTVHLFEPSARGYARAVDNCRVNMALERVHPRRLALSDRRRHVDLLHFRGLHELGSGASYRKKAYEPTVHDRETVEARPLDDVCQELGTSPTLVKIDVEEAEVDVLRGARRLIDAQRTTFLVEVVPDTIKDVCRLLRSYRCHVIDERAGSIIPLELARAELEERAQRERFVNLLFDPVDA